MRSLLISFLLILTISLSAQVKIGDNPTIINSAAALELESTDKALVIPRVEGTGLIQSPVNGMMIYDNLTNCLKVFQSDSWSDCLTFAPATIPKGVISKKKLENNIKNK